jgi:hypothetical protein
VRGKWYDDAISDVRLSSVRLFVMPVAGDTLYLLFRY